MLKYYEVENFRSFKQKTRFSLEKTNYKVLEGTNQIMIYDKKLNKIIKKMYIHSKTCT